MKINGKPVIDATKPLRITISSQDAAKGKTKDPARCAAARAIVRSIPAATGARVHIGRTYIETNKAWVRYITPTGLKTEIVSFDRGAKSAYSEGEYTLYVPSPTLKLGAAKPSRAPGATRHKRKVARAIHQIEGVRARGANK